MNKASFVIRIINMTVKLGRFQNMQQQQRRFCCNSEIFFCIGMCLEIALKREQWRDTERGRG